MMMIYDMGSVQNLLLKEKLFFEAYFSSSSPLSSLPKNIQNVVVKTHFTNDKMYNNM